LAIALAQEVIDLLEVSSSKGGEGGKEKSSRMRHSTRSDFVLSGNKGVKELGLAPRVKGSEPVMEHCFETKCHRLGMETVREGLT
jgi:hypothetical protein